MPPAPLVTHLCQNSGIASSISSALTLQALEYISETGLGTGRLDPIRAALLAFPPPVGRGKGHTPMLITMADPDKVIPSTPAACARVPETPGM